MMHCYTSRELKAFRTNVLNPDCRRRRLFAICSLVLLVVGALVFRFASLQLVEVARWNEWSSKQHFAELTVASERGPILDRNGELLAVSVPAGSVYVRPKVARLTPAQRSELLELLKIPSAKLDAALKDSRSFVWLARQIPRAQAEQVSALGIRGVDHLVESRRFYPYNQGASTLIGKVGLDGSGLSGLEERFEKRLHGQQITSQVVRDALGNPMVMTVSESQVLEPPKGESITLTLDASLQLILDEELERGRQESRARSALGVLIDGETGEILAQGHVPLLNMNTAAISDRSQLQNPVIESVFEPGSILKPFVAGIAMDAGAVSENEVIDCENGRFQFGRHQIKDVHPISKVPFFDVVVQSSNIGMTKVGMRLGRERLYSGLHNFGFGVESGLGLNGESIGILRNVNTWAAVDVATHAFGQGVAVTPLQLVRAMAGVVNDGRMPTLKLVKGEEQAGAVQVVSPKAAAEVREMLVGVVEDPKGTGKKAAIPGVVVGGKTGTAQIARENGRGYKEGAYNVSFLGFAEGRPEFDHRKLVLLVTIQEPNTSSNYGGTLAAPVFQRVMARVLAGLAHRANVGRDRMGIAPHRFGDGSVISNNPAIDGNLGVERISFQP